MVSNVGFKSATNQSKSGTRRKKTISTGLIVIAVLLGLVIIIWVVLNMQDKSLKNKLATLEADTLSINTQIGTALSEEASDSALRAYVMEKELYREYEPNDILNEIENIMVLKSSDGNRVVLKSFQYNSGAYTKKTFKNGSATLTAAGTVTITADADTFDVMAQQIDAFKTSPFFEKVQVGTTDRDDSGRIVFTLTMDVVKYGESPYKTNNSEMNNNQYNISTNDIDRTDDTTAVVNIVNDESKNNDIDKNDSTVEAMSIDESTSEQTQVTQ